MPLIETLNNYPGLVLALALVFGLLVGSFLNVVIHRLPLMMQREWQSECRALLELDNGEQTASEPFNLAVPRSRCPHCGHRITALENIPVFSYLALRGKCSECQAPISIRYPLVELATGLLSALVVYQFGASLQSALLLPLIWGLIALTMIDFDHQLLPDSITLPLLWLGLVANAFGLFTDLHSALWGAVAGYMSLWSVYWLFKLVTGKEGMGYGDFKLLAALGAWMGWQMLPLIIILSSLVGAVLGIGLTLIRGRDSASPMPFGPFLAIAGLVALLWGPLLVERYFQLLGY
ncbi:prepilin peptidase [Motiliproteus sediminis]|uniref:prepilin peptidase n=1 Tax=Motiliproteus sediminis TaxID=1468178 RepID=UPI001AEFDC65|nr:A24 family peptidase [Motiliproteus sediminis]